MSRIFWELFVVISTEVSMLVETKRRDLKH